MLPNPLLPPLVRRFPQDVGVKKFGAMLANTCLGITTNELRLICECVHYNEMAPWILSKPTRAKPDYAMAQVVFLALGVREQLGCGGERQVRNRVGRRQVGISSLGHFQQRSYRSGVTQIGKHSNGEISDPLVRIFAEPKGGFKCFGTPAVVKHLNRSDTEVRIWTGACRNDEWRCLLAVRPQSRRRPPPGGRVLRLQLNHEPLNVRVHET